MKLFRFAEKYGEQTYGSLFWAVTVIDCPEEISDVRLAVGSNGGAAPGVLKIGNRYLCVYGATGGGLGGGHNGRILTMWNKTLDPKSPDFKWTEAVEVCASDGMEDQDAIDTG